MSTIIHNENKLYVKRIDLSKKYLLVSHSSDFSKLFKVEIEDLGLSEEEKKILLAKID